MAAETDQPKQSRRARRRAANADADDNSSADDSSSAEGSLDSTEEGSPDAEEGDAAETEAVEPVNRKERRAAAARRRSKRQKEKSRAEDVGLDASELVDEALARGSDKFGKWFVKNFRALQWVIVVGIAGWVAVTVVEYRTNMAVEATSDILANAIMAERGRVSDDEQPGPDAIDPTPNFKTNQLRLKTAAAGYEKTITERPGAGTETIARLALAGIRLDQGKFDEAAALYAAVKASEIAKTDDDVRGRSIEGAALVLEAKDDIPGAIKGYRELANSDITGLKLLGLYHQARLLKAQGETEKAKVEAMKLHERLEKLKVDNEPAAGFLPQMSQQLFGELMPEPVVPEVPDDPMANPEIQKLLKQLQNQKNQPAP